MAVGAHGMLRPYLYTIDAAKHLEVIENGNRSRKVRNIAKIHLTERAARKIRELLDKDGVSPEQAACASASRAAAASAFLCHAPRHSVAGSRKIFEEFGARLFVDPKSSVPERHDARVRERR